MFFHGWYVSMANDLTVGKPLPAILKMALPIMAGNIFQQFYGMTDTIIVGRFLGRNALAAVGSTSSLYSKRQMKFRFQFTEMFHEGDFKNCLSWR